MSETNAGAESNEHKQLIQRAVVRMVSGRASVPHPYVIVIPPTHGTCLVVNLSSIKGNRSDDNTCTFRAGEHPMITLPSYAFYRGAELLEPETLRNQANPTSTTVSDTLLGKSPWRRLMTGFLESIHTPEEVHQFLIQIPRKK
tara:strand:- start:59 stop:487 length:429 start_codon:yes stop_codon:yes gene_type:complete